MNSPRNRRLGLIASLSAVALAGLAVSLWWWLSPREVGDVRLAAFVHARPAFPVVFTSRSETASLEAVAPEGEGFTEPGRPLWAARQGRLRLLTPHGVVRELTWGVALDDGDTLVDVMSPSVSLDGRRVLFAGRRASGHGRFRLYEIDLAGGPPRQRTGGPDDPGCSALPPLRWRADGSLMDEDERRRVDFDDVDPTELDATGTRIAFVSSRTPDLGRDHARRSTTLWVMDPDGGKHPASANRNNDRWPVLLSSRYLAFSLWSRNREVVTADRRDVRVAVEGEPGATRLTDAWLGAFTQIPGGHFGMLIKPDVPVWRPRPLFVNRIAFMTRFDSGPALTVVQAPPGTLMQAPSSVPAGECLPRCGEELLHRGPTHDVEGQPLWLATPGACPPDQVLLAGAPLRPGRDSPEPGDYGLYLARDDWPVGTATAEAIGLRRLFDDPDLVDAEPVAVYVRNIPRFQTNSPTTEATGPREVPLINGTVHRGPFGQVLATGIDIPSQMGDLPGQKTDAGTGPIFASPATGTVDHLRIYAARRDRFDDPNRPRVAGTWEWIQTVPVRNGVASTWTPADAPTVLAGFDSEGRVARWTTAARDRRGRQATFFAFAGDHYSLTVARGKHFCVGCHPGHSGLSMDAHRHSERLP